VIIAVHEVELQMLGNSGRRHAKSVLGVANFTPSESPLLGSGGNGVAGSSNGFSGQVSAFVDHEELL
jgi:hypothetical protein